MSLAKMFNKKARAVVASVALALGLAGGYAGHQIATHETQPQVSQFTIAQLPQDGSITEQMFYAAQLPKGTVVSPAAVMAQIDEVGNFTARIDAMTQTQDPALKQQMAVSFVTDLRLSENLSEKNYGDLVKDYNSRVGLDVTAVTGNWQKGIMYQQEANIGAKIGAAMGNLFGGDDEDKTPAELSRDVGSLMVEGQSQYDFAGGAGAAGGMLLGGLLLVPALIRMRRGPKVQR